MRNQSTDLQPDADRGALHVDTSDPTPPYEQVRKQLAGLIQSGKLEPGRRLPPLRQLSADLGLAVGTVARTYRELETAGLVVSRRGGGTHVSADVPRQPAAASPSAIDKLAAHYLEEAQRIGVTHQDALDAIRKIMPSRANPAIGREAPVG